MTADLMALDADQRDEAWQTTKRTAPMVPLADVVATVRDSLS